VNNTRLAPTSRSYDAWVRAMRAQAAKHRAERARAVRLMALAHDRGFTYPEIASAFEMRTEQVTRMLRAARVNPNQLAMDLGLPGRPAVGDAAEHAEPS
jgi:hypothetical protein